MSSKTTGATGLAGRYATALFELADADGVLDQVADDLERLESMIHASDDLTRLIRSPVISREDQTRAMAALMEKYAMGELSVRFVGVVAQNRRLFVLPEMIAAYRALLAAHRGEASVEVISAKTLSEKQRTAIGAALKKAVGARIALDVKVDPGLLGGLIVRVGSRMFDSSLSTKLQHLRLAMKGVG
ncbi:MAG: F0F1 ATP synthase subunit delta [Alphaproteobacteria bacterium]|nr:F0F1 ATP synthase subunit delta [Alphaproteobacteria bacterium]